MGKETQHRKEVKKKKAKKEAPSRLP